MTFPLRDGPARLPFVVVGGKGYIYISRYVHSCIQKSSTSSLLPSTDSLHQTRSPENKRCNRYVRIKNRRSLLFFTWHSFSISTYFISVHPGAYYIHGWLYLAALMTLSLDIVQSRTCEYCILYVCMDVVGPTHASLHPPFSHPHPPTHTLYHVKSVKKDHNPAQTTSIKIVGCSISALGFLQVSIWNV